MKLGKRLFFVLLLVVFSACAFASADLVDGQEYEFSGFLTTEKIEGGVKVILTGANQRLPWKTDNPIALADIPLNGAKVGMKEHLIDLAQNNSGSLVIVKGYYHAFSIMLLGAYPGLSVNEVSLLNAKSGAMKKFPAKIVKKFKNGSQEKIRVICSFILPKELTAHEICGNELIPLNASFARNFKAHIDLLKDKGLDILLINVMSIQMNIVVEGTVPALFALAENPYITKIVEDEMVWCSNPPALPVQ